ncbi:rab15 effector protein [Sinocyclocheilus anshuiensis]|uniref:rab15 effector protein n=1 Tax=Sinocyclocheilus anshuiensis TaxID=1608454 RepID=UPI0007BAB590|nr:PREDICTED: rab15 effector protein-like [Sinocyclocheilus anshuiensis]
MKQTDLQYEAKTSFFRTLWAKPNKTASADLIHLFSDCIQAASSRTKGYLLFRDPENKFHPSPSTLSELFLMTYIQHSSLLDLTDTFNCTAMTPEQRILLGAHWVWAVLDQPSKNPRIQIAVQVFHLPERTEDNDEELSLDIYSDIMRMAGMDVVERTQAERMVEFCSSIGRDCYTLFLFFGRQNDEGNIYGLLSNNLQAAVGKCVRIDQVFIDHFFKGAKCFVTPSEMLKAVVGKEGGDPLTMLVKFT